jgi:aspartokinase/homoserine dehydrogenase 1
MLSVPNGVVVDCTASPYPASMYASWLNSGLHVVTPNKKAGSGDLAYYQKVC